MFKHGKDCPDQTQKELWSNKVATNKPYNDIKAIFGELIDVVMYCK